MNKRKIKDKVTIVIPNWNGSELLLKNLPQVIEAKANQKNSIKEIIVVDDCSTDNSLDVLQSVFKDKVRVIRQTKNMGFAHTVNNGVNHSTGQLVCLLNTDVVPDRNFLEHVIFHFRNENIFGVTLHEKGFGPALGLFDGYLKHRSGKEISVPSNTLWVSGGSGIFSKSIWKNIGGLDNTLYAPFYWEDVDLGYRAWKRGYELLWEPRANVVHKHESVINSNNFRKRYMSIIKERNELLFIWRNMTSRSFIKKHISALLSRVIKHPGYIQVVVMALLKLPKVIVLRRIDVQNAMVSDEAIFEKFNGKN